MWLEIGLLHIFKQEKMFMVHMNTSRGSQRHPKYKVKRKRESHVRVEMQFYLDLCQ